MNKSNFSLLRIIVLLLLINAVKMPPALVPVVHWPYMAADAVATPYVILTTHDPIPQEILDHERCHIRQMNTYGSVGFYLINGYYLVRYGYANNPFEEQAYNGCHGIG